MKRFALALLALVLPLFLIPAYASPGSTSIIEAPAMSDFDKAIPIILEHEGGFVNNRHDPGGATNWGISLRRLLKQHDLSIYDYDGDGDVDAEDMRLMPEEDAVAFYRVEFWDRYDYDLLAPQEVATKVFDTCVNTGPRQAHKILQRALRSAGHRVEVDGLLGPQTRAAVIAVSNQQLVLSLRSEQAGFYRVLIVNRPAFIEFISGWNNRAYS